MRLEFAKMLGLVRFQYVIELEAPLSSPSASTPSSIGGFEKLEAETLINDMHQN